MTSTDPSNVTDIVLGKKLSKQQVMSAGFDNNISAAYNALHSDLMYAYETYLNLKTFLIHNNLEFFDSINYMVKGEHDFFQKVSLRVGCIVEVIDDSDIGKLSFALIRGILKHKHTNGNWYAFLVLRWFEDMYSDDDVLKCRRYRLQDVGIDTWKVIHTIAVVDHQPKAHFVHNCKKGECENGTHNASNSEYLRNDFLYTVL